MKVILFKGSDCVPCTHFEPVFDKLSAEFDDKYEFIKETDNFQLMRGLGIRSVPSVVITTDKGAIISSLHSSSLRTAVVKAELESHCSSDESEYE